MSVEILRVTYGDVELTDPALLSKIRSSLNNWQNTVLVKNELLGGDKNPGHAKRLQVNYRDKKDGPHLRISAPEGWYLFASCRVTAARYGGVELDRNPRAIDKLNSALFEAARAQKEGRSLVGFPTIEINNTTMFGDTKEGAKKRAEVQILQTKGDGINLAGIVTTAAVNGASGRLVETIALTVEKGVRELNQRQMDAAHGWISIDEGDTFPSRWIKFNEHPKKE